MRRVCYFSPFIPREWIIAHGFSPCRLALSAELACAGAGAGGCPYAQALVARAERWDDALLVLTTTCDQLRRAAERIALQWAGRSHQDALFVFNVPATWGRGPREQYQAELQRLGDFLVRHGGRAPEGEVLEHHLERAAGVAVAPSRTAQKQGEDHTPKKGIPVAVVGGHLFTEHHMLHYLIRNAGGRVVLNGSEGGERTYPDYAGVSAASGPLEALATAYFDAIPDAFRRPDTGLGEWLARRVRERGAHGVIFHAYAWCDLWRAAHGHLAEVVGVPTLFLELGSSPEINGHTRTRLEAFLESLA
ncbi:MAG: 2-hydroxyacyl-CoA dehydratase [Candidatus Hydrogenedentes bacterium]|nr:2-hydroxyacyl-CoA dehydratase [Candidatus Hydrogenedentota bacterium]